jgi:hypothetical protein
MILLACQICSQLPQLAGSIHGHCRKNRFAGFFSLAG